MLLPSCSSARETDVVHYIDLPVKTSCAMQINVVSNATNA